MNILSLLSLFCGTQNNIFRKMSFLAVQWFWTPLPFIVLTKTVETLKIFSFVSHRIKKVIHVSNVWDRVIIFKISITLKGFSTLFQVVIVDLSTVYISAGKLFYVWSIKNIKAHLSSTSHIIWGIANSAFLKSMTLSISRSWVWFLWNAWIGRKNA